MQIYRFEDKVAISPPGCNRQTIYLEKGEADALLFALMRVGEDITRLPFTKSQYTPETIATTGER